MMPARHARPVAMITGAGRGIGRATAEAFAGEGYAVVLAELRPALGRRAEQALRRSGATASFVPTRTASTGVRRLPIPKPLTEAMAPATNPTTASRSESHTVSVNITWP